MGLIGLEQGLCKINRMEKSRKIGRKREKDRHMIKCLLTEIWVVRWDRKIFCSLSLCVN